MKQIFNQKPLLLFLTVFALIGVASVLLLSAAGTHLSIEAETSVSLTNTTTVDDQTASGGKAIIFNESASITREPAEDLPFDPDHPIYQPIPDNPVLYQYSPQIVSYMGTEPTFNFDTGRESPPIYIGEPTDPIWTLNYTCNNRQVTFRAPENIQSGTGSDFPLLIQDRENSFFTNSGTQPIEFRMWQATIDTQNRTITANGFGAGSYRNDGQTLENMILQPDKVNRALGQAEACGQNTGSGLSYTVGMIRPADIERGRINHAIRVASGYLHNERFFWPATRTEGGGNSQYLTGDDGGAPMGARIFLDQSVDIEALGNQIASQFEDPRQQEFVRIFVTALQEYGIILLDGTESGNNVYFEADQSANWEELIGPVNSFGSYNDLARAISGSLPWGSFRVADPSVFDSFGR